MMRFRKRERASIGRINVIPASVGLCYFRQRWQRINYSGGSRAGDPDNAARNIASPTICLDLLFECVGTDMETFIRRNLAQTVATKAEDVNASLDREMTLFRSVNRQITRG